MRNLLFYGILVLCILNLVRMSAYLVSSDAYTIGNARRRKFRKRWHLPTISVVVPVHNEELTIERCLLSIYKSNYPVNKLEAIVANDGSTDQTEMLVRQFKKYHNDGCKIRLINRPNRGKAAVLNYVMRRSVRNQLVMCLDSDSYLEQNALRNAVQHFRDREVVALSSNVNIIEDGTVLTLLQRFEYLVCYQMKKGQAQLGLEYIVGGIGSMFRKRMLQQVSFYDTNTMTEDIDLTMKILVNKTRKQKIAYAADSIAYTEAAHSVRALMNQRFRWKYGRTQTFFKNYTFFFSTNKKYAKRLTWFMVPFSLLQDLIFTLEPFVISYFMYIILRYGDFHTLFSALFVLTFYLLCNIWASDHLSIKDRLRLTYYAPPMYFLMYVLSFAEYFALIKAVVLLPELRSSINKKHTTWNSPERKKLPLAA